jgi:hypothetical protein
VQGLAREAARREVEALARAGGGLLENRSDDTASCGATPALG